MASLLENIIADTSESSGPEFFRELVLSLHRRGGFDFVFICEVDTKADLGTTLALATNDGLGENFSYRLTGTPCEDVIERTYCRFPSDVCSAYPDDELLAEMAIEGYVGYPLLSGKGQAVGLLVVMSQKPIAEIDNSFDLLKYFARRCELELQKWHLETRLEATERQLEDASRARQSILRNLSHELRTPLNAIIGFSELLQTSALPAFDNDHSTSYLKMIQNAGQALLRSVNDLVDLSAVRSGQYEVRSSEIAVSRVIRDCVEFLRQEYPAHRVVAETPAVDIYVNSDPYLMRSILRHIVDNAAKYSPAGSEIRVTTSEVGDNCQITVQDEGPGISRDNLTELMRALVIEEDPMTKATGGMGIGLAFINHAVTLLEGDLSFNSDSGVGTRVTISLPIFLRDSIGHI